MRLIDADILIKQLEWLDEDDYILFEEVKKTVDKTPTVKAIPIEFIKAFSECLLDRRERFVLETLIEVWEGKRETKVPYINQLLDDWEKENGES